MHTLLLQVLNKETAPFYKPLSFEHSMPMDPYFLKQITKFCIFQVLIEVAVSKEEKSSTSLSIPSPSTQVVFPPAYQAELRQRGSDSSLLILLLYFSISLECLPLFA